MYPPTDHPQMMTFNLQNDQKIVIFWFILFKFDIPLGESLYGFTKSVKNGNIKSRYQLGISPKN